VTQSVKIPVTWYGSDAVIEEWLEYVETILKDKNSDDKIPDKKNFIYNFDFWKISKR
jgi:hypothetical protein